MQKSDFMVVQTISPISLLHHRHNGNRPNGPHPPPLTYIEHDLGKLMERRKRADDLFRCMRALLLFGKIVGVVPISGIYGGRLSRLKFKRCSFGGLWTLGIICILCINTSIAIVGYLREGGRDATALAKNLAGTVCYSVGLWVFIFIFRNSGTLIHLLKRWRETDSPTFNNEDKGLKMAINLIAGCLLTSAIAENAVSHLLLFPLNERVENPLEYYYANSHRPWSLLIPYHFGMAFFVFMCNKWAVYAWNFGDIFIAVISRGLYGRFKLFLEHLEERKLAKWSEALEYHDKLCKLTGEFATLLSPLVFTSFSVNIYFICIQLHLFLAPSTKLDIISSVYVGWSFFHLIARTFTVALAAAKIHDYAHGFAKFLSDVPREAYSIEVERAERKLANFPVGLNGLGAFTIGRPFILSVISVIFTFEIVLLQTTQMMSGAAPEPVEMTSGGMVMGGK